MLPQAGATMSVALLIAYAAEAKTSYACDNVVITFTA